MDNFIKSFRTLVSTHSRAEAAAEIYQKAVDLIGVSTHSRAEAAAVAFAEREPSRDGFNTQPRGGGCCSLVHISIKPHFVSTHSRAEAAASLIKLMI